MKSTASSKDLPLITGARIEIIQASWHRQYTDAMLLCCRRVLEEAGVSTVNVHILPGSLELPLAAQSLLELHKNIDAIIAFGVVVKGDTLHFEMVANGCAQGLADVSLKYNVPVINEVIAVYDIAQPAARSQDDAQNKGLEAAYAAVQMIAWRRKITES